LCASILGPAAQYVEFEKMVDILSAMGKYDKRIERSEAAKLITEVC
jgi:hypothetical protein